MTMTTIVIDGGDDDDDGDDDDYDGDGNDGDDDDDTMLYKMVENVKCALDSSHDCDSDDEYGDTECSARSDGQC